MVYVSHSSLASLPHNFLMKLMMLWNSLMMIYELEAAVVLVVSGVLAVVV